MESFYKDWLQKFAETRKRVKEGSGEAKKATSQSDPIPSTSSNPASTGLNQQSDIVYETDELKLTVEKSRFKRQKNFRLQDHLFKFKVVHKKPHSTLPLLSDLFDFLHAGLIHVLESIKSFYNANDHNIAFLTVHQEPMVNGLNTGGLFC